MNASYANIMHSIQERGRYIGDRSQFESLPIEDYIDDRNMMSTKRQDLVYPSWTLKGLDIDSV